MKQIRGVRQTESFVFQQTASFLDCCSFPLDEGILVLDKHLDRHFFALDVLRHWIFPTLKYPNVLYLCPINFDNDCMSYHCLRGSNLLCNVRCLKHMHMIRLPNHSSDTSSSSPSCWPLRCSILLWERHRQRPFSRLRDRNLRLRDHNTLRFCFKRM